MEAVRERRAGARREERRRTGDRGKPILPQRAREDVHEDAQAAEQREEEDLEELHMRRRRATTVAVNTLRWRSGRRVERGERLFTIEAMKMETAVYAETAATVREVAVEAGHRVEAHDLIVVLDPDG